MKTKLTKFTSPSEKFKEEILKALEKKYANTKQK